MCWLLLVVIPVTTLAVLVALLLVVRFFDHNGLL